MDANTQKAHIFKKFKDPRLRILYVKLGWEEI